MNKPTIIGWSMGMNRWLDETGVFHLMVDRDGETTTACGNQPLYIGGAVEANPPYGHKCRKCLQVEESLQPPFVLYRNTKDRCEHEQEGTFIDQCDEAKEEISYDKFKKLSEGLTDLARSLGYRPAKFIKHDWSVHFYKSTYAGLPCLLLSHTECDFIFLRERDRERFANAFAEGMTEMDWKRATEFGPDGTITPR